MGNSCSIQGERIYIDNDTAFSRINNEANVILKIILAADCNNRSDLIGQIGAQKIEELTNSFDVCTLQAVSNRLEIDSCQTNSRNSSPCQRKKNLAVNIVNFYIDKINLNIANCNMYKNLNDKIDTETVTTQGLVEMYKKMKEFNDSVRAKYEELANELSQLQNDPRCPDYMANDGFKDIVVEDDLIGDNQRFNDVNIREEKAQIPLSLNRSYTEKSMGTNNNSPMLPVSPVSPRQSLNNLNQSLNSNKTVNSAPSFSAPKMERMETPTFQNKPIARQATSFATMPSEPVVHTVVKEVPVTHRTIYRPVISKREVVREELPQERLQREEKDVMRMASEMIPFTPKDIVIPTPVVPAAVVPAAVVSPVVSAAVIPTPVVPTPVVPTPVVPTPVSNLPIIPLHSPSAKVVIPPVINSNKTVTVKTNEKGVPLVQVTQTVHKSQIPAIQNALPPGGRIVKIEPSPVIPGTPRVVNTPLVPPPGTPVRAIGRHIPGTAGEIPLVHGQATTYLQPGPRGWAYVRHADGSQGYVPASHLSL